MFHLPAVIEPEFFENSKRSSFCIPHRFHHVASLAPTLVKGVKCAQCLQVIRALKGSASKCHGIPFFPFFLHSFLFKFPPFVLSSEQTECGIYVHHHCELLTPPTCGIAKELVNYGNSALPDYFGVNLEEQAKQEGRSVPRLVNLCVQAVEDRGISSLRFKSS